MPSYYRLIANNLSAGDLIQPGSYGRFVIEYGERHGAYRREMAYEQVRSISFPHRPSRLSSLFCFLTIREAALFRQHISGFSDHHLYEMSSDENEAFVADPNNALQNQNLPFFDMRIIQWYWQGWSPPPNAGATILREVLLRKAAIIVRKIEREGCL